MGLRLLQSFLVLALVALVLGLAWWNDEEVARRRRAWLDGRVWPWLEARVPAWVWDLPEMAMFGVGIVSLIGLPSWLVYTWVQWVRFG